MPVLLHSCLCVNTQSLWSYYGVICCASFVELYGSVLGLCDMDKKYISRFLDFFSDFDFNHDFDTNRHALSYTSYLFLHILLVFAHLTCFCTSCLAHLVLHISLFYYTFYSLFLFFTYIYALVWCYFYIICILCTVHWADLIWSTFHFWLPCIIYHVTNKETLTFTVINAFCVNLKHISKGNQLDLSQKVVTCL